MENIFQRAKIPARPVLHGVACGAARKIDKSINGHVLWPGGKNQLRQILLLLSFSLLIASLLSSVCDDKRRIAFSLCFTSTSNTELDFLLMPSQVFGDRFVYTLFFLLFDKWHGNLARITNWFLSRNFFQNPSARANFWKISAETIVSVEVLFCWFTLMDIFF